MRSRSVLAVLVALLFLTPAMVGADRNKAGPVGGVRAEDVLKELAKTTFTARRDLPAEENIFIENGKVMEELFLLSQREHPVAVAAGKTATVSKVILMDTALQILFREKCGFVILTGEQQDLRNMTLPQVVDVARRGLGVVFQINSADQKPKLPT
jgi:hypothetical protein